MCAFPRKRCLYVFVSSRTSSSIGSVMNMDQYSIGSRTGLLRLDWAERVEPGVPLKVLTLTVTRSGFHSLWCFPTTEARGPSPGAGGAGKVLGGALTDADGALEG